MMFFENARLIVAGILLVILTLSGLSAGLFWLYRGAEGDRRSQIERTAFLERDLSAIRDEKDRLVARMVLNRGGSSGTDAGFEKKAKEGESSLSAENVHRPPAASEALADPVVPQRVVVRDYSVVPDPINKGFDVRFKLINTGPGRASGHVFAVLKPDAENSDTWRVVPEVALESGRPVDYQNGHEFSISRYKAMHLRVKNVASCALVALWAYSKDGTLLLRHEFSSDR